MPDLLDKTLRLFLDGIGRREEYEFYLQRFLGEGTPAFAMLCPDADSIRDAAEVLIFDLQFLMRLDLVPLIVVGGDDVGRSIQPLVRFNDAVDVISSPSSISDWLKDCRKRSRIPVLAEPGHVVDTLQRIVPDVSRRVHWVRASGGFLSGLGELIQIVYTEKQLSDDLGDEDKVLLEWCRALLRSQPSLHVSISSPLSLLEELFTIKGSGTLIRPGSVIQSMRATDVIDSGRLVSLLEDAFGRALRDSDGWRSSDVIYLESKYRGAALVEHGVVGDYLTKFAVGAEARGLGLAQELWREVTAQHSRLFWRSRESNPINPWYKQHADGRHRANGWMIFWRGIPVEDIADVISACLVRPPDFIEDG